MEGMTVLNIIDNPIWGFTWNFGSIFVLIIIVGIIVLGVSLTCITQDIDPILLALLLAGFFTIFLFLLGETKIDSYPTYEVIITDEISMVELNEKYEIVKQRGEIYEIKERET